MAAVRFPDSPNITRTGGRATMTVTLADVAARAQVSPATVSRVLNGNYPVAASTRERVLKAVDELDYVLNGPASALA
ncbi:LacI family DNA-binding transcriptional regulator, partial [Streptomyces scabiei]|uniref:LacI family DNA-binding transcriptional regulator n=1 Tax=Streptomyces scabiei TaxID=1930 RepID=UPI00211B09BA